jgi:ATP-binding cassette, subfamily B, bacterial PglK
MIVSTFTEMASIGAILPFLATLTSPKDIYNHELIQPLIVFFNLSSPEQLLLPMTIIFIVTSIISGAVRLLLLYSMSRLSFSTGADLSIDIYRRTLYQGYAEHLEQNSSSVINGIITKTNTVVSGTLSPMLILVNGVILVIGVLFMLFAIDTVAALSVLLGFGFLYWLITILTRKRIAKNSSHIASESTKMIKALQEGLGGIRDVLIDGTQEYYSDMYRKADLRLRRAAFENSFIGAAPHSIMTTIGMILITLLAYSLSQRDDGIALAIPVLGSLALGAQRLLPAVQQIYHSLTAIRSSSQSLNDVLELLSKSIAQSVKNDNLKLVKFEKSIELKNMNFKYTEGTPLILKDINLTIKKGDVVGFIGKTGSGKSTLIDIIMGLLHANKNSLFIDNKVVNEGNSCEWSLHIAHVPQSIYLSDSTIAENIAFGIPENDIDYELVKRVSKQAQIFETIEKWDKGYQTFVGERGVRLSGGQRQRIGIARALYKNADVLVLDEATSALDHETEKLIMNSIERLNNSLTILMIAHRVTTLDNCTKIVEVSNGEIIKINTSTGVGK